MTSRLSLWQTKLKAAKAEQHQHEKMLRQQYRALERIQKQMDCLETVKDRTEDLLQLLEYPS